jgi:hypothetical protein
MRIICAGNIIFLNVALSCIVNTCDLVKRFTVLGERRILPWARCQASWPPFLTLNLPTEVIIIINGD